MKVRHFWKIILNIRDKTSETEKIKVSDDLSPMARDDLLQKDSTNFKLILIDNKSLWLVHFLNLFSVKLYASTETHTSLCFYPVQLFYERHYHSLWTKFEEFDEIWVFDERSYQLLGLVIDKYH